MKTLLLLSLLISNLVTLYPSTPEILPPHTLLPLKESPASQHAALLHKSSKQTNQITAYMVEALQSITESINYWNQQQFSSFTPNMTRNPITWLYSRDKQVALKEKLDFLNHERDQLLYYIGRLAYNIQELITLINTSEFLPKVFLQLTLINHCLTHHTISNTTTLEKQSPTIKDIFALYHSNHEKIVVWPFESYKRTAPYIMPGHFQRNIGWYTLGAVSILAALYYAPSKLETNNFFVNNIILPIKKYYTALDKNNIITKEACQESAASFASLWRDYLKKCHSELSEQERELCIQNALKNGNSSLLYRDWHKQIEHPFYNAATGKELELLNIRLQLWEYVGYNTLEKAQAVTKGILTFAPLALAAGATLYMTKKIISLLPARNNQKEIHHILHQIYSTLNTQQPSDDIQVFIYHGTLIYLTEALKKHLSSIDSSLRHDFIKDSRALASFELTPEQKLRLIDQLYQHSSWLKS